MMFKEKVSQLLQEVLLGRQDLFLIELKITEDNKIKIALDGDNGVNLQDCIDVSRQLETHLDREEIDFSLEVASAGVTTPLVLPRQYVKNLGRKLKVITTSNQVIEAFVKEADNEKVSLEWKTREPKKVGKGKETVEKELTLPYTEIKEATVIISF